jgi:hypothetical protein
MLDALDDSDAEKVDTYLRDLPPAQEAAILAALAGG